MKILSDALVTLRLRVVKLVQVCRLLNQSLLLLTSLHQFIPDWVQDKRRSKFALAGICWQLSYIPILVWQVGNSTTNIIESLHSDANSEGTFCTLVGGIKRGQHFDGMKLQSLQVSLRLHHAYISRCQDANLTSSRYTKLQAFDLHINMVMYLTTSKGGWSERVRIFYYANYPKPKLVII